jgi:DNA-directed RNA polymerase alpha subunit
MTAIPQTSKPAASAFEHAGIRTLEDLARHSERDLLAIHGVGPKAIRILREELEARGMSLKPDHA